MKSFTREQIVANNLIMSWICVRIHAEFGFKELAALGASRELYDDCVTFLHLFVSSSPSGHCGQVEQNLWRSRAMSVRELTCMEWTTGRYV